MLLGYRVSQKSILWPLVAVMLPGWLLLVFLVRRPATDMHTQLALRSRVAQQMLAYDHAETLEIPAQGKTSLPGRRARIETLFQQAEQAGLITDAQRTDEAVVWLRLGDPDKAAASLAGVVQPKTAGPYLAITQKTVQHQSLTDDDKQVLQDLMTRLPDDWWVNTLAQWQGLGRSSPAFASQRQWAWWQLRLADGLLPALGILALLLAIPAIKCLRSPWSIWPYSERVQHLWPVALMLCVLSLRGLFLLLGGSVARIVLPLISWAGQRDVFTVFHIQVCLGFLFNMLVLIGTTYGVKECVASHWGTLGDVLGFERRELLNRKLWCVAFPGAIALTYGLQPLPELLDHWHIGGTSIFDSLSRSPGGLNTLGMLLSVIQAVALAPFFEEVIYRGFLLSALRNCFGPLLALVLSSILFALAHGSSLTGLVTELILGAAYGSIKLHTGRLGVAILLHACVSAIQVAVLLLQGG